MEFQKSYRFENGGGEILGDAQVGEVHRVLHVEGVEVEGGVGESVDADFAGNDVGLLHLGD